MSYCIKKALFLIVYLLFSAIIASGVLSIEGLAFLKIILLLANLILFLYISCGITYQDGQKAFKVRISNDKERERIVLTGEDCKLDLKGEYHISKGFIIGALSCLPLVVLLVIYAIMGSNNPDAQGMGQIAGAIYLLVYGFFNIDAYNVQTVVMYASYYWALLAIPVIVLSQGIAYYLGARKIECQQEKIKETHNRIYGE